MVKFVADSSADLLTIPDVNFESVPLVISTDDNSWVDDQELDVNEMLKTLASYKGRSYTACPSVEAWMKAFEGADTVYAAVLTSALSGAYNAAMTAKEQFQDEHPEVKIHVFDTLTTTAGIRMLMEKLIEMDGQGLPFEEIVEKGEKYVHQTRLFFSFQSLHNFAQNGRVNKALAAAIGMLGIRIVGTASKDGKLAPIAKCRGDRPAMAEILRQIEDTGFTKGKIRIGHIDNIKLAQTYQKKLEDRYPEADIAIYEARGLCSYYGERGGIFIGLGK